MAYDGAYAGAGQQRAYAGHAAQRPAPRAYNDRPPPVRRHEAPRPYNDYDSGYGYSDQGSAYGQQQYQNYGQPQPQPQPPHDFYGGPQMPPGGRGGPIFRPATADGHRAGPYPPRGREMRPPPGRGMAGPGRGRGQYPDVDARPPPINGPPGRRDHGRGMGQHLPEQMSAMSLRGPGPGGRVQGRSSSESYRGPGDYGRPADDRRGPRAWDSATPDHGDPSQGPPPGQAPGGQGAHDGAYDAGHNGHPHGDYGPPSRSVTMPMSKATERFDMVPPPRMDSMSYGGPAERGLPPRPSTTTGSRPPPRTRYPEDATTQADWYQGGYGGARDYGRQQAPTSDDVFNSYFDDGGIGNQGHGFQPQPSRSSLPDFDSAAAGRGRRSFDQPIRHGSEQQHPGAHQTPRLHHARSEANFHEPQTAIFEMAGDIPSVPPVPRPNAYQPEFSDGYGSAGGYEQAAPPQAGPMVTPGPANGHGPGVVSRGGGDGSRTSTGPSQSVNADTLPSHPAPVRPGLMANSIVSVNERPPPVRHYGGLPQTAPTQPRHAPQQALQGQQARAVARAGHQAPEAMATEEPPVTPQELESLRMTIKSNSNDQASALRLAKRLIEATDVLAPKLPDPKQRARARERYLLDAHKILKKLSNTQNQDAMFLMADSLGKGIFGHEPDNKEAFTLYQSAAKLGHAAAAYRTAVCCEIGHEEGGGTRKDPLKAMQWYKRAATLGDPPAMYKVGMILLKGLLGQARNPREAVGWLRRAADQADSENPHALHELGLLYESAQPNDAIIRDEAYALSLFQQAAELGYKFSQFRLGCAHEFGLLGCPIDPRQSIYWYSKAATQEEHQAELALSGWYLTGSEGVLGQSDTEAYLWARKAAVAGLAKAEYAMGYFTEVGIGIAANLEDAKRWYWRAAAQDFPKARERLEDLKKTGKNGNPRQRERISRSRIEKQQDGECTVM